MDHFLNLCHSAQEQKLNPRMNETGFENELRRSVMDLASKCKEENLVKFLTLVLDKLILLMVRPPVISEQISK